MMLFNEHNHFIKLFGRVSLSWKPLNDHWFNEIYQLQPTIETTLTCAYCQQLGHELNNCPFKDDKLKRLMKKNFELLYNLWY
jgi:hypothetical protein